MIARARKLLEKVQELLPESNEGVHILAYHLIEAGSAFPIDISRKMFESHMRELNSIATVCSLEDAVQRLETSRADSTIAVVTFDDAFQNFYTVAWPVLRDLRIPVTLYVPVDFVEAGRPSPIQNANLPACTWDELAEMCESNLISIGSHTCSHPDLRSLERSAAESEIINSRRRLEEKLGVTVRSFCYPKALWSGKTEDIVRTAYENAVIGGGCRMTSRSWNRYRLNRIPVRRNTTSSISKLLKSRVWLEEKVASTIRPVLSRAGSKGY